MHPRSGGNRAPAASDDVAGDPRIHPIFQPRRLAGQRAIDLQPDHRRGGNHDFDEPGLPRLNGRLDGPCRLRSVPDVRRGRRARRRLSRGGCRDRWARRNGLGAGVAAGGARRRVRAARRRFAPRARSRGRTRRRRRRRPGGRRSSGLPPGSGGGRSRIRCLCTRSRCRGRFSRSRGWFFDQRFRLGHRLWRARNCWAAGRGGDGGWFSRLSLSSRNKGAARCRGDAPGRQQNESDRLDIHNSTPLDAPT